jgi:hypothetical protein
MSPGDPARVFRPAPNVVIRGSVSCLTAGLIAGAIVASSLFLCVAIALWFAPL